LRLNFRVEASRTRIDDDEQVAKPPRIEAVTAGCYEPSIGWAHQGLAVDAVSSKSGLIGAHVAGSPRDKVKSIEEIAAIARSCRERGQVVVQAHGAFDLIHLGHVRHLEAARALGEVLIVSLTADRFVNKGPGRPVFNEALRAEMLAALEYVDWVTISESPDAVHAIDAIRPDFYVKGQDYVNPDGDVTGKIVSERETVEAYGGQVAFTDDLVFSSSELINRHFNIFEPSVRDHLDALRRAGGLAEMLDLIERVRDFRVLLVGDAIIDEYQYTLPIGKPPKENLIAARFQNRELFAGGVFAAANHVAAFCKQVEIVTCLGGVHGYEDLIRKNLRPNVALHAVKREGAPTTLKQRFVDPTHMRKLFEVYFMDDEPLLAPVQAEVDTALAARAAAADVVIVTDYGHGLIATSSIEALMTASRFLAVSSQSNSANMGYNLITKYPRADYVCIDAAEAHLAAADRLASLGDVARRLLRGPIDCPKMIVTHGQHGCVTCERDGPLHTIPAVARNVIDTVGAGDAFLSVTAPLVAAGGTLDRVGFIGNVVGALKVEIVGHRRSVDKAAVVKSLTGLLR
jgi:rfaE bifunctional protein nucleotidyltransferase chain/domain